MLCLLRKHLNFLNTILKYVVSLTSMSYITYKIVNTAFSWSQFKTILSFKSLVMILSLTVINWIFEILKWETVINTFHKITFRKAAHQTLVAYTYGLVTPFNTGNYAKKIFFYPKKHRKHIIFLNLSKGIYQMLVTVITGSWGIYILINDIDIQLLNQQLFVITSGLIGLVISFIFRKKIITLIKILSLKVHIKLFLYSFIKFICFSLVLVIMLFQKEFSVLKLYAGICAIYLLSSLLPILNILDFAIKGSVALWLLIPLGYNEENILISYFILWICNHVAPASLGSFVQFYKPQKQLDD